MMAGLGSQAGSAPALHHASSFVLPAARDASIGEGVPAENPSPEATVDKRKKKAVHTSAKTKLQMADTKLEEVEDLKVEIQNCEKPDVCLNL